MTFDDAAALIMGAEIEGEVARDPEDAGGLTKWGISSASFPEVLESSFTRERAVQIYRTDFWRLFQCEALPPGVDLLFFDCAVNQTQQAPRLLQRAVNVKPDGLIGPITLRAAALAEPVGLIRELAARRALAYAQHPAVGTFGLGWFRRLMTVTIAALKESQAN